MCILIKFPLKFSDDAITVDDALMMDGFQQCLSSKFQIRTFELTDKVMLNTSSVNDKHVYKQTHTPKFLY